MFQASAWRRRRVAPINGRCLLSVVIIVVLLAPNWVMAEEESRVAELETRVAELEALVEQLMAARMDIESTTQPLPAHSVTEMQADHADKKIVAETGGRASGKKPRADGQKSAKTEQRNRYQFGGYIKVDSLFSRYSDGDLPGESPGRNFYIPATIPVGGIKESVDVDIHARQSRFYFRSAHSLDNGDEIATHLEMDFLITDGGNERVSNSYQPRMRHAYLKYRHWLIGQTWSTFMNVDALPDTLDFVGPAESAVFTRQAQIRYQRGGFAIALENPETTVSPLGGGARITTDDNLLPDVTASYRHDGKHGYVQLSGLLRQLEYEDDGVARGMPAIDDRRLGWGLSLSGVYRLGRDDVRWMMTSGRGMGRYFGLNLSNAAVITDQARLKAIRSSGGFLAYRHWWNERWRSSFILSYTEINNPGAYVGALATDDVWSGHFNLLYSPFPDFSLGAEYIHARRKIEDGRQGRLNRLQFSSKYVF